MTTAISTIGDKDDLRGLLYEMRDSMADVLPKHLTPDRMVKLAMVAASRQPELLQCTRASVAKAVMTSSELGLDCSGVNGEAWLVPFHNNKIGAKEAILIPGYKGLIKLARQSGEVADVQPGCVHEKDVFRHQLGTNAFIDHQRCLRGDPGDVYAFYAKLIYKSGIEQYAIMRRDEVDARRARSKASGGGAWVTDYIPMGLKTVIKEVMRTAPQSPELQRGLEDEESAELNPDYGINIVTEAPQTGVKALEGKIKTRKAQAAPPPTPPADEPTPPPADEPPVDEPFGDAGEEPQSAPADQPMSIPDVKAAPLNRICSFYGRVSATRPAAKSTFYTIGSGAHTIDVGVKTTDDPRLKTGDEVFAVVKVGEYRDKRTFWAESIEMVTE